MTCLLPVSLLLSGCGAHYRSARSVEFDDPAACRRALSDLQEKIALTEEPSADLLACQAVTAYFAGQIALADASSRSALAREPADALATYVQGLLSERDGEWDRAHDLYRRWPQLTNRTGNLDGLLRARLAYVERQMARRQAAEEAEVDSLFTAEPKSDHIVVHQLRPFGGGHVDSVLALGVTHYLTRTFALVPGLTVVDQTRQEILADEIRRSRSELLTSDANHLVERWVQAGLAVSGDTGVSAEDSQTVVVEYSMDDVAYREGGYPLDRSIQDGEPVTSSSRHLLVDLGREVARICKESLQIELTPEVERKLMRPPTRSYEAFLAYAEGLECERRGDQSCALAHFSAARDFDPGFTWAGEASERVSEVGAGGEAMPPDFSVPDVAPGLLDETLISVVAGADDLLSGEQEDPPDIPPQLTTIRIIAVIP
jgi:tetratricopeptide (TPR) repeat protein